MKPISTLLTTKIRMLEAAKTEAEFDKMMYDLVEDHNYKWFLSEGLSDSEARARAAMNRRKAGG